MSKRLEITVSDEVWDRLDAARGHEPRASFVKRALAEKLNGGPTFVIDRSVFEAPPVSRERAAELHAAEEQEHLEAQRREIARVSPGFDARAVAMERQRKLNAARDKKR